MQAVGYSIAVRSTRQRRCRRRRNVAMRRLLALAVALTALLAVPKVVYTLAEDAKATTATHVVAAGETLWEIASAHSQGEDVRKVVAAIQRSNGLKGAVIWPGQVLEIPSGTGR